jgi:hypothetical protein
MVGQNLDESCQIQESLLQSNIVGTAIANTIGYTRKQAHKERFDEECAKVNEEKNAARERAIQNNIRRAKNA